MAMLSRPQLTPADLLFQTYFPILRFQPDILKTRFVSVPLRSLPTTGVTQAYEGYFVQPLEVRDWALSRGRKKSHLKMANCVYVYVCVECLQEELTLQGTVGEQLWEQTMLNSEDYVIQSLVLLCRNSFSQYTYCSNIHSPSKMA